MGAQYAIGIDLGTTNCVVAYAPLEAESPRVELFDIPQLVAPGTVDGRKSLSSFAYLAPDSESDTGSLDVPWEGDRSMAVGEFARTQSAERPERTVVAAKSWLAHSRVDRRDAILPWNAPSEVDKISPVTAARWYLEHLAAAWLAAFPDAPLVEQQVVLTVPASFDAAARELTREAALLAGLPSELVLLEEPQAAAYAWLDSCGDRWREQLQPGSRILVCDVGGGTSDLTLIEADQEEGELVLRRVAVGNHLLVGGDNMDLALAHFAAGLFAEKGLQLDAWQSVGLWHACRAAKEALLAEGGPEHYSVSVLGRGSQVIGGTVSVDLPRPEAMAMLTDGFFPRCNLAERPVRQRASGFQEMGLPFETDAAITRHLAAFVSDQSRDDGACAPPTHVLFNGGVFKAPRFRQQVQETLASWFDQEEPPTELAGEQDLDFAVARGAAYYAWTKEHGGVRIRGGIPRAYYVGIETAGLAIPGAPRPLRALCVAPLGMEEGAEVDVPSDEIGLVLGESVQFRFFSSAVRPQDQPGDVLANWDDEELIETDSLEAVLDCDDAIDEPFVPVRFQTRVTELGVFELWCVSTVSERRWKLEFSVRDTVGAA